MLFPVALPAVVLAVAASAVLSMFSAWICEARASGTSCSAQSPSHNRTSYIFFTLRRTEVRINTYITTVVKYPQQPISRTQNKNRVSLQAPTFART